MHWPPPHALQGWNAALIRAHKSESRAGGGRAPRSLPLRARSLLPDPHRPPLAAPPLPTSINSLLAGKSGVGSIDRFDASEFPTTFAAQIRNFDNEG